MEELFANRKLIPFNGKDSQSPLDYIHPYRKADVAKILASVPESVEMLIVYGSSLGDYLYDDSDLDLAVVSADRACYNRRIIEALGLEAEADVHVFSSLDELLSQAKGFFPTPKAIVDEGLTIYVKNKTVRVV
jgi:predicted nucleotidyltransferase